MLDNDFSKRITKMKDYKDMNKDELLNRINILEGTIESITTRFEKSQNKVAFFEDLLLSKNAEIQILKINKELA